MWHLKTCFVKLITFLDYDETEQLNRAEKVSLKLSETSPADPGTVVCCVTSSA